LRGRAEAGTPRPAGRQEGLSFFAAGYRGLGVLEEDFRKRKTGSGAAPRGAAGRALFAREPGRVRADEPGRLRQPPRELPRAPAEEPGLRLQLERLRRE